MITIGTSIIAVVFFTTPLQPWQPPPSLPLPRTRPPRFVLRLLRMHRRPCFPFNPVLVHLALQFLVPFPSLFQKAFGAVQ